MSKKLVLSITEYHENLAKEIQQNSTDEASSYIRRRMIDHWSANTQELEQIETLCDIELR